MSINENNLPNVPSRKVVDSSVNKRTIVKDKESAVESSSWMDCISVGEYEQQVKVIPIIQNVLPMSRKWIIFSPGQERRRSIENTDSM